MLKTQKISILIVEDHALTRFGLKTAFESMRDDKIILEAEDGESGVRIAEAHKPDIVLMDLGLPGINGIEAAKLIKKTNPGCKVIILTSHNKEEEVWTALSIGANAYCMKDIAPERLIQVVESVYEGAAWLDPSIADIVLKYFAQNTNHNHFGDNGNDSALKLLLTDREKDVLKNIVDGFNNADIAVKLCVSIHTVKAHVCSILQKLSVDDRTQAAIKALKDGIV